MGLPPNVGVCEGVRVWEKVSVKLSVPVRVKDWLRVRVKGPVPLPVADLV